MSHCANCGAPLPHGAEFCPRCGVNLAVAPALETSQPISPATEAQPSAPPREAQPIPPAMDRRPPSAAATPSDRRWWIVPLVIIVLVVVAFAVMLFMPFGGGEEGHAPREVAKTDTIEEATPAPSGPAETGTVVDLGAPPTTTTTAVTVPPPVAAAPVTTTTIASAPPRRIEITPPAAPAEISESEAVATLSGYVTSRRYYEDVGPECIGITSAGYQNEGYTLKVHDTCDSRTLGRWRVDSKTREVFRQREDGRYLRP